MEFDTLFYHLIVGRVLSSINQRNDELLHPPSSGISSLGLHSYAGKSSYVGNKEGNPTTENLGLTSNPSNIAVVRPQQQLRKNRPSSPRAGTGNSNDTTDLPPLEPPTNRKWFNLFGVIDTDKLGNLFGRGKLRLIREIIKNSAI